MPRQKETATVKDERTAPFVWVHLEFCKLELDPATKAVYLHVVRRARRGSGSEICYESIENIAHWSNVSVSVVKRSLKTLVDYNLLTRESIPGKTSHYHLTDPEEWKAPKLSEPNRKDEPQKQDKENTDPGQKQPRSNLTQVKSDPGGGSNLTQVPRSNLTHDLDPYELDPYELDPDICGGKIEPVKNRGSEVSQIELGLEVKPSSESEQVSTNLLSGLEVQTDVSDSTEVLAETKVPPRAEKSSKKKNQKKSEMDPEQIALIVETYHNTKGERWSSMISFGKNRILTFNRWIEIFGSFEAALSAMEKALKYAASNDYWSGKTGKATDLGFRVLTCGNHITEWVEAYENAQKLSAPKPFQGRHPSEPVPQSIDRPAPPPVRSPEEIERMRATSQKYFRTPAKKPPQEPRPLQSVSSEESERVLNNLGIYREA